MRIAIFTNAYKPIISGVVNTIELMRQSYISKGHEVLVLTPGYYDYVDQDNNIFRYKWINLTHNQKFPIAIPFSCKADKTIKNFKPDIIHTHHPFVLGKVACYYSKKLNVPLVFTYHTQYEMYAHYVPLPSRIVKSICRNTVKNFSQKCDAVTTPAGSIANLLKSYGIQKKVHVIPNSVNLGDYKNVPQEKVINIKKTYGLENKTVIVYVGRIAPEKNLLFLIRAFQKLMLSNLNCMLMIVGDGPQLNELKNYASNTKIRDNIVFTGRVDYKDIAAYYRAADIFATCSVSEVKPLTILEALAADLPVVAVDAPGASDTITHMQDGLLTKCDEDDFTQSLSKLISDSDLYLRLKKGASATSYMYSINRISDSYLELYESLRN